jgi:polyisoprenoid-binding protein YceI
MFTRFLASIWLAAALAFAAIIPALATPWTVVPADSKIAFSGEHAGTKFKGTFEKWDAVIAFDPANLPASKATVTVQLASAKTGDTTYDKTLPTLDWFDIAKGPTGVFETTAFRTTGPDKYEADATLSLRGIKVPVVFAFDFKATGDTAKLVGKAELKRMDFGIGKTSDATGAWVSLSIPLEVTVGLKKG